MERTAALALIGLGVDAVYAEEIARTLSANNLDTATLDGIHWWSSQRWHLDPVAAIQEARIGWWVSPAIDFQYKRLLDTRFEGEPTDAGPPGPRGFDPVVVWDGGTDRFVDQAKSLLPVAQAMLQRQWAEAWRQWPRFSMEPDISPALPAFSSLKGLIDFYEHVRPHGHDPAHPAHVLRIFLDALYASKAWDEAAHPRHRAGTSEGGRFAPKRTGTSDADRSLNYEEYMRVLRAERGEDATERVHFDAVREKAGERDAYPPALWPALPPAAEAELNAFEQDISFETIERAQIYDAGGTLIAEAVGDTTSVGMAIPRQFMPGIINTHNHPNLSPPSGEDIVVGIQYGAQEFRAVSGEYVYAAKLPVVADEQNRAALARTVYDAWQQVEKDVRSDLQGYIDSGDISVAMAVHVYPELVSAKFADDIERHGITIERKRLIPDRKLTADEARAVDAAWREGISGFYSTDGGEFVGGPRAARAVKGSKIAIYRTQSNNSGRAGRFTDESMSGGFFELATQRGATSIYTVSDTRLSRLYLKRQLSSEERKAVGDAFEAAVTRYTDYARERVGDSVGERLGAIDNAETNRIRDVAWRDTAAKYPKLFEYHAGWIPSFDPRELAESGRWKPGDSAGLPLKAWDEAAHPRHRAGTPVDPATGAGGGRFAPKESSAAPAAPAPSAFDTYAAALEKSRREHRNKIMPDEWPPMPPEVKAKIVKFAQSITWDGTETVQVYDAAGNLIGHGTGDHEGVNIPDIEAFTPGAVVVHNHPNMSGISIDDVEQAILQGARELWATNGDYAWVMELPVVPDAYNRMLFRNDAASYLEQLMRTTKSLVASRLDAGEIGVPEANHLRTSMGDRLFVDRWGGERGFGVRVERLWPERKLTPNELALVEKVHDQDESTSMHDLGNGKAAVYRAPKTDRLALTYYAKGFAPDTLRYAVEHGANTVIGVSDARVSRLYIKRKLTGAEVDGIARTWTDTVKKEYETSERRVIAHGNDRSKVWPIIDQYAGSNFRAKGWRAAADKYPDAIEYHDSWLPRLDPEELMKTDDWRKTREASKAWDEAAHPRHRAGTPVDDGTGAGGGRFAPKDSSTPEPAGDTNIGEGSANRDVPRVWSGEEHEQPDKVPSKQLVGELGENLVRQIMTDLVGEKFRALNDGRSNAPIDLFGDHMAIEVKAGLASNRHDSRKWRATIGEPGKAEKELLAQMTPEEKLKHNDWKREEILRRKADLADQLSAHTPDGKPVEQVTVGLIFKPDLTAVDVYVIDGYHLTLRWSQYATDEHYLDTYKVDPQWPKN